MIVQNNSITVQKGCSAVCIAEDTIVSAAPVKLHCTAFEKITWCLSHRRNGTYFRDTGTTDEHSLSIIIVVAGSTTATLKPTRNTIVRRCHCLHFSLKYYPKDSTSEDERSRIWSIIAWQQLCCIFDRLWHAAQVGTGASFINAHPPE